MVKIPFRILCERQKNPIKKHGCNDKLKHDDNYVSSKISSPINRYPSKLDIAIYRKTRLAFCAFEKGDRERAEFFLSEALDLLIPNKYSNKKSMENNALFFVNGMFPALQSRTQGLINNEFTQLTINLMRSKSSVSFLKTLRSTLIGLYQYMLSSDSGNPPLFGPRAAALELAYILIPQVSNVAELSILYLLGKDYLDLANARYKEIFDIDIVFNQKINPNLVTKKITILNKSENYLLLCLNKSRIRTELSRKAEYDASLNLGKLYKMRGQHELSNYYFINTDRLLLLDRKLTENSYTTWQKKWLIAQNFEQLGDFTSALEHYELATNLLLSSKLNRRRYTLPDQRWAFIFKKATFSSIDPFPESNQQNFFSDYISVLSKSRPVSIEKLISVMEIARRFTSAFLIQELSYPSDRYIKKYFPNFDDVKKTYMDGPAYQDSVSINSIQYFKTKAILYYFYAEKYNILYIIASDGKGRIDVKRNTLTRFDELLFKIESPERINGDTSDQLRKLYDLTLSEVEAFLPKTGSKEILIIPHHFLFSVPFSALLDGSGTPLIDKCAVKYLLNLSHLERKLSKNNDKFHYKISIVFNPISTDVEKWGKLSYADKEAELIARSYPGESIQLLSRRKADESSVMKAITESEYVHFATHAFALGSNPLLSSIVVTPDKEGGKNDGFITVNEIRHSSLNNTLIMIDSCYAGKGPFFGDGIAGFANEFLRAGVHNIGLPLWEVNDEVAKTVMINLYKGITKGMSPAKALQQAQQKAKNIYPSEIFWAPFVVYSVD
jgi:CHAT domain-containing protein